MNAPFPQQRMSLPVIPRNADPKKVVALVRDVNLLKLPCSICERRSKSGNITIVDREGKTLLRVPFDNNKDDSALRDHTTAILIVALLNTLCKHAAVHFSSDEVVA